MERSIESRTAMHRIRNLLSFRRDKMRSEARTSPRHSVGKEKKMKIKEKSDWEIAREERDEYNVIARANGNGQYPDVSEDSIPLHALMPGERRTLFDARDAFPAASAHVEKTEIVGDIHSILSSSVNKRLVLDCHNILNVC